MIFEPDLSNIQIFRAGLSIDFSSSFEGSLLHKRFVQLEHRGSGQRIGYDTTANMIYEFGDGLSTEITVSRFVRKLPVMKKQFESSVILA